MRSRRRTTLSATPLVRSSARNWPRPRNPDGFLCGDSTRPFSQYGVHLHRMAHDGSAVWTNPGRLKTPFGGGKCGDISENLPRSHDTAGGRSLEVSVERKSGSLKQHYAYSPPTFFSNRNYCCDYHSYLAFFTSFDSFIVPLQKASATRSLQRRHPKARQLLNE